MSLKKKIKQLTLIEDWHEAEISNRNYLAELFAITTETNIFNNIFVCIRNNPTSEDEEESFSYYNVGMDNSEIADYFNTKFSLNYFAYDYKDEKQFLQLGRKMNSIYRANLYKYKKLIEVLGYTYNPLFNVDGIELYSRGEAIGDGTSTRTPSGTITTTTGSAANNTIGNTTSTFYKNPYNLKGTDPDFVEAKTETSAITSKQEYSDGYNEKTDFNNIPANNYKYDETQAEWKPNGVFSIAAKDNAFGVEFNGPERYYAEKKIRQGNIGVTKSTELLQSQREVVRFNILDEFFNDLQREIVVGIY